MPDAGSNTDFHDAFFNQLNAELNSDSECTQESEPVALLISPSKEDLQVFPREVAFTKTEMSELLGGADFTAFRLQDGGLLLVNSLACLPQPEEENTVATCVLRTAVDDPGGRVCGSALMLTRAESEALSSTEQTELFLGRGQVSRKVLVLDRNEAFRSVLALAFQKNNCSVVQARTLAECLSFCKQHLIDILVADVNSLRPKPSEARQSIEQIQTQVALLLISGYDRDRIEEWHPGLLRDVEFLQKPFGLHLIRPFVDRVKRAKPKGQLLVMARRDPDSET